MRAIVRKLEISFCTNIELFSDKIKYIKLQNMIFFLKKTLFNEISYPGYGRNFDKKNSFF